MIGKNGINENKPITTIPRPGSFQWEHYTTHKTNNKTITSGNKD
jgi:hypothetical protein